MRACRQLAAVRLRFIRDARTLPGCAGAAINARIRHVYFGAFDPKGGARSGR